MGACVPAGGLVGSCRRRLIPAESGRIAPEVQPLLSARWQACIQSVHMQIATKLHSQLGVSLKASASKAAQFLLPHSAPEVLGSGGQSSLQLQRTHQSQSRCCWFPAPASRASRSGQADVRGRAGGNRHAVSPVKKAWSSCIAQPHVEPLTTTAEASRPAHAKNLENTMMDEG